MEVKLDLRHGKIRRLASEYLLPALETPLRAFHRVSLVPGHGATAAYELMLDPNFCSLDDYGEPIGCTKMAIFHYSVALERMAEAPGQTLYSIEGKDLPARLHLLILDAPTRGECPARLLVINDEKRITQIVHLHPTDRAGAT